MQAALFRKLTDETADAKGARAFFRHLTSLTATKLADGLIDPKLILSWLLNNLGAPGYVIGALVPVREAGALLPQLALSRLIEARRIRKWVWAAGSAIQGGAALGIAICAVLLEGAAAGWAILAFLALLAIARSACSASYKDILARTVPKGARGTVSGLAGTVAAALVLAFALSLSIGVIPRSATAIAAAIAIAGGLWLAAAAVFSTLNEDPAETTEAGFEGLSDMIAPLKEDAELRHYIAARALLIATALAPPFLVLLSGQDQSGAELGNLGLLMLASSLAAICSSYVWGRLSDKSSRQTLSFAAVAASLVFAAAAFIGLSTGGLGPVWMAPLAVFLAQIAYEGVRAGRKTHLTDMDTHGRKSLYTALSNSMIGVLLLAGGAFGLMADLLGPAWVLATFALMSAAGAATAWQLREVQQEDGNSA